MENVSFCFYGQVKNYSQDILNSFNKNILLPICEFFQPKTISKFLVTFNNKEIYNPRNKENNIINYASILDYIKFDDYKIIDINSEEIKKIDNMASESVKRFGGSWGEDSLYSTKYAIRQLYSLNLIQKFSKDNINIMVRPDVKFLNRIFLKEIEIKQKDILVPSFLTNKIYCNDRFAICLNKKTLQMYCNRFENFLLFNETYNSEEFLMKQIKENNINLGELDIKFVRIRANNQIESRDLNLT